MVPALIGNLALCLCELIALANLRNKADLWKYYTYFQNAFALLTSLLFSIYLLGAVFLGCAIPEYIRGLRYVASCGLGAAAVIYLVFLSPGGKNPFTAEDFVHISPRMANLLLHWLCPGLSILSFLLLERTIPLAAPIWTGLAALPSGLYWGMYLILTLGKCWDPPYDFTPEGKPNPLREALTMALIPLAFLAISILLWELN